MKLKSRLLLGVVPCLMLAISYPVIAAGLSPWAEANTKYQSGSFKGAVELYENVLKSGKETAALDYNLGNAHFRLGHKGKALLFYERALRVAPRDKDTLWNIDIVKTAIADRIDTPDESLLLYWVRGIVNRLTMNEICWILSGLLVLWTVLSILTFIFPIIKPAGKALGILIFLFFVPVIALFAFKWLDVKDPQIVVLDKEVQARYGPSEKETKAFVLHEGAKAKVTDESKDWIDVALPDKNSGWIPKKSCEII